MGFHLEQQQTQKLVMTTQMKQAIDILQCTALELNDYIAEMVQPNPLIEWIPISAKMGRVKAVYSPTSMRVSATAAGTSGLPSMDQWVTQEPDLAELLDLEIRISDAPGDVAHLARRLIDLLDESGYLRETDEWLAEYFGESLEKVRNAVNVLQGCEPLGIGCRTLQECLRRQLQLIPERLRASTEVIIGEHLPEVADGKLPQIARKMRVSVALVQDSVDAIRRLNPRPGLGLRKSPSAYIVPDVVVERVGEEFVVQTNDGAQPTIRIYPRYRHWVDGKTFGTSELQQYVLQKMQTAEWIIRCLEQRRLTLFRVAESIVRAQEGFFRIGPSAMRPLTLRHIADELGLHESTISRATRGKYMQTPRGIFEMKHFFSAELHGDGGASSAVAAKHQIQKLVGEEDPTQPLSDDAIATQLAEAGIHISRRTVAKYREELHIASSSRRRRFVNSK